MADTYTLRDGGPVTTLQKTGVVSGTTTGYYTLADFDAIRTGLGRLEKDAPHTYGALQGLINKGALSANTEAFDHMVAEGLDTQDRLAIKAAGLEGQAITALLDVKRAMPALAGGKPELFLRGEGGRPVTPHALKTTTADLKKAIKGLKPEAAQELRQILNGAKTEISNRDLASALHGAGLSASGYLPGRDMQDMRGLLLKAVDADLTAAGAPPPAAHIGSSFMRAAATPAKTAVTPKPAAGPR